MVRVQVQLPSGNDPPPTKPRLSSSLRRPDLQEAAMGEHMEFVTEGDFPFNFTLRVKPRADETHEASHVRYKISTDRRVVWYSWFRSETQTTVTIWKLSTGVCSFRSLSPLTTTYACQLNKESPPRLKLRRSSG